MPDLLRFARSRVGLVDCDACSRRGRWPASCPASCSTTAGAAAACCPAAPCPPRPPARPPPRPACAGRRRLEAPDRWAARCRRRPAAPAVRTAARTPHEEHVPAVGRPHRRGVEIDARRHVLHLARRHVVNRDEAEWSVRVVTNAILRPSGDHFGSLCTPHSVMKAFSPRSTSLAGFHRRHLGAEDLAVLDEQQRAAIGRELRIRGIHHPPCPARSAGARRPDRMLRPARVRRRIRRPASRLGASPRRKMTVLPSSEMRTADIMMPSSFRKLVSLHRP